MPSVASRFSKQIHKLPEQDKTLPLPFAKVGIEIEVESCNRSIMQLQQDFPNWQAHVDDSLRNLGMEFTTPGGMVGSQIREAVESFCPKAKELGFSEGYPRAGIHLHIDVTDMNEDSDTELLHMIQAYMLYEHAFFAFAGEWRRACGFCDSLLTSQADFPAISRLLHGWNSFNQEQLSEEYFSKYQAVNFLPMQRFGTLEIRHLPTTLDSVRIMDWIKMALCLKRFGKTVDESPLAIMLKHGPEVLTKIVFKGHEKLIRKYINEKELMAAIPEVMSLRIMRKQGKFDPWENPNNPLLEIKRVKKEPKTKATAAVTAYAATEAASLTALPRVSMAQIQARLDGAFRLTTTNHDDPVPADYNL